MMKQLFYLASAVFILASTSANATVWHPTSGDTDFIQLEIGGPGSGISTNGGTLALFDDDSSLDPLNALEIGSSGGQVFFSDNGGGDWLAEINGDSIVLTGGNEFVLGVTWDGTTYWGDFDSFLVGDDSYLIVFVEDPDAAPGAGPGPVAGSTLAVDLAPIPVPASVWLFGSGLLGLVGVARRHV
jgi:hypothetical protein